MEEEEKYSYEDKYLIDLTDPNEPSEDQYLASLKDSSKQVDLTEKNGSSEKGNLESSKDNA